MKTNKQTLSLGAVLSRLFVSGTFIRHLLTEVYCNRLIGLFRGPPCFKEGGTGRRRRLLLLAVSYVTLG